jgi:Flp pilus assembly protein TadG
MKHVVVPRTTRAEDGEVSVEAVMVFPFFLLMIFAIAQLSFSWYGRAALNGAAQDYLSVLQTNSTGEAGYRDPAAVATATMKQNAGFVHVVSVTPSGLPDGRVKVTIIGRVPAPFPGATRTIAGVAVGTLDNFRRRGEVTP